MKIATERAQARYASGPGKTSNLRQIDRYLNQVGRLFKSDELKLSLDTIEAPELPLTCQIFADFNVFTDIQICSEFCSHSQLEKFKLNLEKLEEDEDRKPGMMEKMSLWNNVERDEPGKIGGSAEKRTLTQDPRMNYVVYDALSKQITRNEQLITFHLINQKLS